MKRGGVETHLRGRLSLIKGHFLLEALDWESLVDPLNVVPPLQTCGNSSLYKTREIL